MTESISKKEIEEEITAIKEVLKIHSNTIVEHHKGVKINEFLIKLLEKELESFK
jgi:hypothetical protein